MNWATTAFLPATCLAWMGAAVADDIVTQARQLQAEGKSVEALLVLGACLRPERQRVFTRRLLEECLYAGEYVARDVMKGTFPQSSEDKVVQAFDKIGMGLPWSHYGDSYYYDHGFFNVLAEKYPDSKYAQEFEYFRIYRTEDGDWERSVAETEAYLKLFPKGPYAQASTLYLAQIYHELWSDLTFDAEWPAGDPPPDNAPAVAEEFRGKALKLYTAAFSMTPNPIAELSSDELDYQRRQLEGLKNGERAGFSVLIND